MLAMFRGDGSRVTRRALAKLALSESLPLPAGLPDFPLSFRLLPEALLPVELAKDDLEYAAWILGSDAQLPPPVSIPWVLQ